MTIHQVDEGVADRLILVVGGHVQSGARGEVIRRRRLVIGDLRHADLAKLLPGPPFDVTQPCVLMGACRSDHPPTLPGGTRRFRLRQDEPNGAAEVHRGGDVDARRS